MLQAELRALGSSGRRQATAQCPGDSEDHTSTAEVRAPALSTPHASQSSVRAAARLSRREGRGCSRLTRERPSPSARGHPKTLQAPFFEKPKTSYFQFRLDSRSGCWCQTGPRDRQSGSFLQVCRRLSPSSSQTDSLSRPPCSQEWEQPCHLRSGPTPPEFPGPIWPIGPFLAHP